MSWNHPHGVQRRARIGRFVVLGTTGALLVAFARVQILNSEKYALQSETNRLRPIPIPAPRGLIVDRNGVVLADNEPGYSIALLASSSESLLTTISRLEPALVLDSADRGRVLRAYRRSPTEPVVILRDAPFDVVSALEERRIWVPGLVVQSEPKRRYPFGPIAAHVVGYVGEISETELQARQYPGARIGTLVGRDGVESAFDARLRGREGFKFVEVDALGRTVRGASEESTLKPQPGETISTALDIGLQEFTAETFPPEWRGAVVAMDPRNGEVLVLYSTPSYDPNEFIGGFDIERWRELSTAADYPLLNRATQARYPPASPWKLVMAAMALKRGLVTMESRMPIPCRGGFQYYNRYFRCWRGTGHGYLTLAGAIEHSCDVYFYQLGLRLTLDSLLHHSIELGFGERSGIDLPDEYPPVFPASRDYFDRLYGPRGWTNAVTLNLVIGQGENAQTLISMVRFYAMLANPDGSAPEPRVVLGSPPGDVRSLGLQPEQLAGLRDALVRVVDQGTAVGARIAQLRIAGKTGTAQNSLGPDHGWFIGFAPADDPQIVVGSVVEFGKHGSAVARIVTPIIARYLLGDSVPPIRASDVELLLPDDSAPPPLPILPDSAQLRSMTGDSTGRGPRTR
jgi:penicillin-binding protein 2